MKKRIISLLLAVLVIAGMFSAIGVSAYADNADEFEWLEHTVKKNENVYSICQKLGIDFYKNMNLISSVNGITNYNAIQPGKLLKLPKPDVDYSGYKSGSSSSAAPAAPSSAVTPSAPSSGKIVIPDGDYVALYLVPVTMQQGDTVYNLCRSLGISFNSYSEQIKTLNKIKSYSDVKAGTTLLLPSSTAPANTGNAYKVMAHKVGSGDTAGKIVSAYNMNYNSNVEVLKALNNSSNLDKIKVGQIFYVAIPAGTSTGSGSGSGSGTGTGAGTGTGTGTGSSATVKTYDITLAKASNGSFTVNVDGKAANKAAAGATVTVKTSPNSGCSLEKITVTKTSNGASVAVDKNGCFVMPACAVTVNVSFTTQHRIYFNNHGNGEAEGLINGAEGFWAKKGQTVGVKTISHVGYCVTKVVVTNNKTGAQIPMSNGTFTMPDNDVTVDVYFDKAANSSCWLRHDTGKGSFETMVNGIAVDVAEIGKEVYVVPLAGSGKEITSFTYTRLDNGLAYKLTNTDHFTMPNTDVGISVTFKDKTSYAINIPSVSGGSAVAQVNGENVSSAVSGATVTLVPSAKDGYKLTKALFNGSDITSALSFTMPAKKANIELTFEKVVAPTYTIEDKTADPHGKVKINVDGKEAAKAAENALVELAIEPDNGYKVSGIEVYANGKILSKYTEGSSSFFMPAANVQFKVSYASASYTVDTVQSAHGTFTAKVGGSNVTTADAGKQVDISYKAEKGYVLDNAYVTVLVDGEEQVKYDKSIIRGDGSVYFQMPASDVVVYLTFAAEKTYTVTCDAMTQITVDGETVASGSAVAYGEVVKVSAIGSSVVGRNYNIRVAEQTSGSTLASSHNDSVLFTMPQDNVIISSDASVNTLKLVQSDKPDVSVVTEFKEINKDMVTIESGYFAPDSDTQISVTPGAWVVVEPYYCPHGTGWMYTLEVKDGNGNKIASSTEKGVNFTMPANGATVTVKYYK